MVGPLGLEPRTKGL